MSRYVDGFVIPVPREKMDDYLRTAENAGRVWREHGALQYCECLGEDMDVSFGLPFPRLVQPKEGEVIVFAFIVFASREERDRINAAVMADPRMDMKDIPMCFDVDRMAYGGFTTLVDA